MWTKSHMIIDIIRILIANVKYAPRSSPLSHGLSKTAFQREIVDILVLMSIYYCF